MLPGFGVPYFSRPAGHGVPNPPRPGIQDSVAVARHLGRLCRPLPGEVAGLEERAAPERAISRAKRQFTLPNWVWVKTKPPGDRRFLSMFPLARISFWVPFFDPQPILLVRSFHFVLGFVRSCWFQDRWGSHWLEVALHMWEIRPSLCESAEGPSR